MIWMKEMEGCELLFSMNSRVVVYVNFPGSRRPSAKRLDDGV